MTHKAIPFQKRRNSPTYHTILSSTNTNIVGYDSSNLDSIMSSITDQTIHPLNSYMKLKDKNYAKKSSKLIKKLNAKFLESNSTIDSNERKEEKNKNDKIKNKFKNYHHHAVPTSVKKFNPYINNRFFKTEFKNEKYYNPNHNIYVTKNMPINMKKNLLEEWFEMFQPKNQKRTKYRSPTNKNIQTKKDLKKSNRDIYDEQDFLMFWD